jgi:hypothetical protein
VLLAYFSNLNVATVGFSETSVNLYQAARRQIAKDSTPYVQNYENFRAKILSHVWGYVNNSEFSIGLLYLLVLLLQSRSVTINLQQFTTNLEPNSRLLTIGSLLILVLGSLLLQLFNTPTAAS